MRARVGLRSAVLFHWPKEQIVDFYARLADEAPVERVVLGELVCSKRLPFYEQALPDGDRAAATAGKRVAMTSLALPTLPRERAAARELFRSASRSTQRPLGALGAADDQRVLDRPADQRLQRGDARLSRPPGARRFAAARVAFRVSSRSLPSAASRAGVAVEVWAFGRAPLAISARCYSRARSRTCEGFMPVCLWRGSRRPAVRTVDGRDFLAINGVQTLSHTSSTSSATSKSSPPPASRGCGFRPRAAILSA